MGGVARRRRFGARIPAPVVVVQGDALKSEPDRGRDVHSADEQMTWADAPGSTRLSARATSLPRDSVANASRIITIDRSFLDERVGRLAPKHLVQILHGMNVVLGR